VKSIRNKKKLFNRICHLIHEDGSGGGPTTVIKHIKYYHRDYDVVFLAGNSGRVVEFCKTEGVKCIRLPIDRLWKCLWGWIPLWYHLYRQSPDVLILHGQWAGPLGALVGRMAGIRKIIYIAHWPAFYTDWDFYRVIRNHLVESIPVHLCDRTICISPDNHYQYQLRYPDQLEKFIQICNPFDTSTLPSSSDATVMRQHLGWTDELIHVVSVGRLATQKHLEWLLQSWVIVQKEIPAARLWIVGDGEEEHRLKELAAKLEITGTCTFLGAHPKGIDFINAADVVAMTSLYEGHANIPMEAHACRKPIVANDVDGIRHSVCHGIDGFLVPPGDIRQFAERLIHLCRSREQRKTFGEEGIKNLQKFSLENLMHQYTALIREMITT